MKSNLKFISIFVFFCTFAIIFSGCSLNGRNDGKVKLSLKMSHPKRPDQITQAFYQPNTSFLTDPTDISNFACLAVNVIAPDIEATGNGNNDPVDWSALFNNTDYCGYRGFTSPLVPNVDGAQLSVEVTAGYDRVFQVIGTSIGSGFCPTNETFGDLEDTYGESFIDTVLGNFYVVGQNTFDVFSDTQVSLSSSYTTTNPRNYDNCGNDGTELPLVGGWKGMANNANFATGPSTDWSAPSGFSATPLAPATLTAGEIGDLTDNNTTSHVLIEANNLTGEYARMDFAFDVTGMNLSNYAEIRFEMDGYAGMRTSAGCNGTIDTGGLHAKVQALAGWSANDVFTSNSTSTVYLEASSPELPSNHYSSFTTPPTGNIIKLSIQSSIPSGPATDCSVLRINEVKAIIKQ